MKWNNNNITIIISRLLKFILLHILFWRYVSSENLKLIFKISLIELATQVTQIKTYTYVIV